jgi:hypothetical protein
MIENKYLELQKLVPAPKDYYYFKIRQKDNKFYIGLTDKYYGGFRNIIHIEGYYTADELYDKLCNKIESLKEIKKINYPKPEIFDVIPNEMRDIMVTYKKVIYNPLYRNNKQIKTITKRGFYNRALDGISIPPRYEMFNGRLLPDGWGGDHISLNEVIKWEYCE